MKGFVGLVVMTGVLLGSGWAAAEEGERQVYAGVTGIGALSTVAVTGGANPFGNKVGFGGGARASTDLMGDVLGLSLGVAFSPRGMTSQVRSSLAEEEEEAPVETLITRYNTVQVPLLVDLRFLRRDQWQVFLGAGPTATVFLSRQSRYLDGTWRTPESNADLRRVTLGIAGTVGAEFDVGFGRLALELRYDRDLVPFVIPDGSPLRLYHSAFSVLGSLSLPVFSW